MNRFIIFLFLASSSFTSCTEIFNEEITVINEITNNDRKAVLFLKGGNAVTNVAFHVMICNAEDRLKNKDVGNVLVAELTQDMGSSHPMSIKWLNNNTLNIELPKSTKVFKKEKYLDGIKITYTLTGL